MIIVWKGWGILVLVAGIGGLVVGGVLASALGAGGAAAAAGLIMAALANWGLCKLLYRKPAGNWEVSPPVSAHSLFFIPAKAFTWIFAALAVPMAFFGVLAAKDDKVRAATPGYASFKAADDLIDSKSKGLVHGNTPEAKAAAESFSDLIKTIQAVSFTGGSKRNLLTGGEFLTYCHHAEDAVIFLCHVPELRNYKDESSKAALAQIAWAAAKTTALRLDPEGKKKVMVGLRGISSYGFTMQGSHQDEKTPRLDSSGKTELFYPLFANPKAAPATPES